MLYYIYIGNSQTAIDHLSKVTNGMFVTVSGARKAAKIIDGIRERYNTSIQGNAMRHLSGNVRSVPIKVYPH